MATCIPLDNLVRKALSEGLSKPLAHGVWHLSYTDSPPAPWKFHAQQKADPAQAIRDGVLVERTIHTLLPVILKPQTNSLLNMA